MEPANDQNIYIDSGKLNCLSDSAYFLENWNECLPNETFESIILEFKEEEAKAIVLYRDEARRCYYSNREGLIFFYNYSVTPTSHE